MAISKTRSGKYAASLRGPDGRERQRTFRTKAEAERWERESRSDVGRGTFAALSRDRATVGDWAPLLLAGLVHVTPKTKDRYAGIVSTHIIPTWGPRRLDSITHAEVQAWVARLGDEGQKPASVRKIHGVLSRVLDLAIADGKLALNRAAGVNLPRVAASKHRYLTHQQVAELAAQMSRPRDVLLVQVLAYCGLRWGELAALRIADTDLLRRRLDVHRSVTEVGGRLIWGEPKDHERRSVPLPLFLVDGLAALCASRDRDELLFAGAQGTVLRVGNFRRDVFDRAAEAIELEGLHPHELRHTAASLAISAGANVKAVQLMLGHARASMTLDVYADLFPDDLEEVAEALNAARAQSLADISRTSRTLVPLRSEAHPL